MKKHYDPFAFSKKTNIIFHLIIGGFTLLCLFPFVYVILISLTSEQALATYGYSIIPKEWSLDAYRYLWATRAQIFRAYGVTIFITLVGTVIGVTMMSLYAYAISRKQFAYRRFFTFIVFFTMLFSGGMVPFYIVMTQLLNLKDSIWALILPMCLNAFHIMILRTFFKRSVPDAIVESAQMDGAGEFRIFFQIVFPIAIPGIATIALFSTLALWNDWFNALLFIENTKLMPLQAVLMQIENNMEFVRRNAMLSTQSDALLSSIPQDSAIMAMVVIAVLPIALSYPFFQKYFVRGLTIGSVKE